MIKFELITLTGTKFSEQVHEVRLPTPQGEIGVFKDHAPLISLASPGIITIRKKANHPDELLEYYTTNGGIIEVIEDSVRLLADEAEDSSEISEDEAQKAFEHAKQLQKEAKDQVSLDKAQSLLDRSSVRLKVADLKRRKRRH